MIIESPCDDVELVPVPLHDYVLQGVESWGSLPAIIDGPAGQVLTYGELASSVRKAAAGLAARGVAQGDVLALCSSPRTWPRRQAGTASRPSASIPASPGSACPSGPWPVPRRPGRPRPGCTRGSGRSCGLAAAPSRPSWPGSSPGWPPVTTTGSAAAIFLCMTTSTRSSPAAKVSGIITSSGSLAASLASPLATATVDVKDRIDWVIAQGWSVVGVRRAAYAW